MRPDATEHQILGSLYGGALGDAFASAAEGKQKINVSLYQPSWVVTDDTQLTSSTCDAIAAARSVAAEHIASKLREDFQRDLYTGLGSSTLGAMRALSAGAHWALAGIQGERAAGSGAAMRIAPLAFLLDLDDWTDRQCFRDVVRITHRNEEALAGARALAVGIQYLLEHRPSSLHDFLKEVASCIFDSRTRDNLVLICEASSSSYQDVAERVGTSGFAAQSVPMALVAAWQGMEQGIDVMFDAIVSEGGDTDTIASMAGQLLGASLGFDALPEQMLEQVVGRHSLDESFSRFARFAIER